MSKTANPGDFCWNELMTNEVEKCKEFYSALFGWEIQDHHFEHFTYTLFKKSGTDVGGMMPVPADKASFIPPHWMSYVSVSDVNETVSKAKKLGATIKQEPIPVSNFGLMAVLEDPSGAHIALWQSLNPC